MPDIGRCNYKKCSKVKECERFKSDYQDYKCYDFKNICNSDNNYQYLWLNQQAIVKEDKNDFR